MNNIEINKNINGISLESAQAAAKYWAEFLPPVKSWLDLAIKGVDYMMGFDHSFPSITKKQYDIFVKTLTNEILNLEPPYGRHKEYVEIDVYYNDGCIDLGSYRDFITHRSFENAPTIVLEAIKAAGIEELDNFPNSLLYSFPRKICMQIYNIGHVRVKTPYYEKIIYTKPNVIHYANTDNVNFGNAAHVKIKGDSFRLVEIKLKDLPKNLLYASAWNFDFDDIVGIKPKVTVNITVEENVSVKYFAKSKEAIIDEALFTKLRTEDVKGGYEVLSSLTNQDLTDIFQDPIKLAELINDNAITYFSNERRESIKGDSYIFIGNVIAESLGDDYYQYSTPSAWIIKSPDICKERLCTVISDYDMYIIQPDDMLFKLDGSNDLYIFPASMQGKFALYACEDYECSITSNNTLHLSMSEEF